ncbi:NAD(P)-binding protein [Lepidopterella palustris CBS 459.81]|uniref:NAD(P)-binding protein n=1 Tax=Lepidopterella palustris CBS 459.81 TaxID=1314670 RepID=A0A8E2ED43_9PEZI|nr:NAD(P)-binding protein [Lepidopterella palustris CBS 459.81]
MPVSLITGATGKHGGVTMNALLDSSRSGLEIHELTRNPNSAAAISLSKRDVHLVKGDLLNRQSLRAALKDVEVAYLVTDSNGPRYVEREVEQGKLFVECFFIVFSSVAGADTATEVENFYSKYLIEEKIRPTAFLGNTFH